MKQVILGAVRIIVLCGALGVLFATLQPEKIAAAEKDKYNPQTLICSTWVNWVDSDGRLHSLPVTGTKEACASGTYLLCSPTVCNPNFTPPTEI